MMLSISHVNLNFHLGNLPVGIPKLAFVLEYCGNKWNTYREIWFSTFFAAHAEIKQKSLKSTGENFHLFSYIFSSSVFVIKMKLKICFWNFNFLWNKISFEKEKDDNFLDFHNKTFSDAWNCFCFKGNSPAFFWNWTQFLL